MKNPANQGARRRAYGHTSKPCNAEWRGFSWLPFGLDLSARARGVAHARQATGLSALCALRSQADKSNAISKNSVNRP
ncbi:MAG: hypothetical protein GAK30_00893 [Paracidovorax wautersii]|uniref:Uncharacterized protein n=1 Tax=Paracidovorax wautersii TaxID=1177982 RepID=A0A7V8JR58_9BURK|nr:MAG: hypothetical protein GAK30_00893 [Paracidovorax wautersii]